jgi:hypothetical protein
VYLSVTVLSVGGVHAQDLHGNRCTDDFYLADQRDNDVLAMMLIGFMQVTHLALIELIKSRVGIGPWFYEFKAKVVAELKTPIGDGVGIADEIDFRRCHGPSD